MITELNDILDFHTSIDQFNFKETLFHYLNLFYFQSLEAYFSAGWSDMSLSYDVS